MPKSQTSLEFLYLVVIAFMVSLIFTVLTLFQQGNIALEKEAILLKDMALKVQSEIFLAENVADGYYRIFEIPNKLDEFDYNISVTNSTFLVAESKNQLVILRISSINGTINKGSNIIQKNDGIIKIN